MLNAEDLCSIKKTPTHKNLTLKTLQEFYYKYLCNCCFVYKVDDPTVDEIQLRFTEGNFCHLLGIHGIMANTRDSHLYKGKSGYRLVEDGTVTLDYLKKHGKANYGEYKKRIFTFPFAYQIIHNPTVIEYVPNIGSRISANHLMYDYFDSKYLHLAIRRSNKNNYYHPITYLQKNHKRHFIDGRKELNVISTDIRYDFILSQQAK